MTTPGPRGDVARFLYRDAPELVRRGGGTVEVAPGAEAADISKLGERALGGYRAFSSDGGLSCADGIGEHAQFSSARWRR